jgi:hypothetical protein
MAHNFANWKQLRNYIKGIDHEATVAHSELCSKILAATKLKIIAQCKQL